MWRRLIRRLAWREIQEAWRDGHQVGQRTAPASCGALHHDPSDFWYDPGC